jgi:hypothetical protein
MALLGFMHVVSIRRARNCWSTNIPMGGPRCEIYKQTQQNGKCIVSAQRWSMTLLTLVAALRRP